MISRFLPSTLLTCFLALFSPTDVVHAKDATNPMLPARVLLLSADIDDADILANAVRENVAVVKFDPQTASLESINRQLAQVADGISSIAIAVHGNENGFRIDQGDQTSLESIHNSETQREFWRRLGKKITENGRIDLLACDLAKGRRGCRLVSQLEKISGRNIAASTNKTGNAANGADWTLETDGQDIETAYFNPVKLKKFTGTLAAYIKTLDDGGEDFGHDNFACDNNYAIVGGNDQNAYIYKADGGQWNLTDTISNSDSATILSVGIYGDYAVAGSPFLTVNEEYGTGGVYVFKRDGETWTEQAKLLASDGAGGDKFGYAVYMHGDYIIVGAPWAYIDTDQCGVAYIFKRDGENWSEIKKLVPSDPSFARGFGYANEVVISQDYALVGASFTDNYTGAAYIFHNDADQWNQQALLPAPSKGSFGQKVSISGDYIAIAGRSEGGGYIYHWNGSVWGEEEIVQLNELSMHGDYIAGEIDNSRDSRTMHVMKRDGAGWRIVYADPNNDSTSSGLYKITDDYVFRCINPYNQYINSAVHIIDLDAPGIFVEHNGMATDMNTSTNAKSFAVDDKDTDLNTLTLSASSSDQTILPDANISFGGSGKDRTITMTPAAGKSGSLVVTVTISDGTKSSDYEFTLFVNDPWVSKIIAEDDWSGWNNLSSTSSGQCLGDYFLGQGGYYQKVGDYWQFLAATPFVFPITFNDPDCVLASRNVYNRSGNNWVLEADVSGTNIPFHWWASCLVMDGDVVYKGATEYSDGGKADVGKVVIAKETDPANGVWSKYAYEFMASDPTAYAYFGQSIAVSGAYVAVTGAGNIYIFKRSGDSWTETAKLEGATLGGIIGQVSMSGDYLATPGEDSVYIFKRSGEDWNKTAEFTIPGLVSEYDYPTVSLAGDCLAVGADEVIHIYKRSGEDWLHMAEISPPEECDRYLSYGFFLQNIHNDGNHLAVRGEHVSDYGIFKTQYIFNIGLLNEPPTVANPIADVVVDEDSPDTVIDLTNIFTDIDDDDALIVKTISTNSNASLLTATINGNQLTLDYQNDQSGEATIVIRGTSNLPCQFVEDSFTVTVNALPRYTLTVNGGNGGGNYKAGAVVDIEAGSANFKQWTGDTEHVADINASPTTVTMPDSDVTISASYNPIPEDYQFVDNGDGTVTVTGYTGSGGDIAIPSTLDGGKAVVAIGAAFQNLASLTSAELPTGIISLGTGAFSGCENLISVNIPDGATSIGDSAFSGCASLVSITMPDSVTSLGNSVFYNCSSLISVQLSTGINNIGYGVFRNCAALTAIEIPNGVTAIGADAFKDCSSLTTANIPDSVISIGDGAFWDCEALASATLGDHVASIGESAFHNCGLTSIIIPDSVTLIEMYAFRICSDATSIHIGEGLQEIRTSVFAGCSSASSLHIGSKVTEISIDAFTNCDGLTSVEIPASVTTVWSRAFKYCDNLVSAEFQGDAPTTFYSEVFDNCATGFTIYYHSLQSGWSTPTWNGYPCQPIVGANRVLTYTAGAGGTISGATPQTVVHGTDGTAVSADPDPDYHFVNWSDGSTENPRTDTAVTRNISVTANFSDTYRLTVHYGTGDGNHRPGTVVNIAADPPEFGKRFYQWTGATTNIADINSDSTTITMPDGDTTIIATYQNDNYNISGTISGEVVASVRINISGDKTGSCYSDASGNYSISMPNHGDYTITPLKTNYNFSPATLSVSIDSADSTGNDFVSSEVPRAISGTISGDVAEGVTIAMTGAATATTTSAADGSYSFGNLKSGDYNLTPSLDGYVFAPPNKAVTVDMADSTGNDFTAYAGGVPEVAFVNHAATGANDGTSWTDAYTDPQTAIDNVPEGWTQQIWVAAGTYKPSGWPNGGSGEREKHFSLKNGVTLYGGFAGTETSLDQRDAAANPTILSGDIGAIGNSTDNCVHVFYHPDGTVIDETAVLDGVTISDGYADYPFPDNCGGGMYNYGANVSPSLLNCLFTDNFATSSGGAIYNYQAPISLTNCLFSNNSARDYYGGAIKNYRTSTSHPTLIGCVFTGNSTTSGNGGAISNEESSPSIINCVFTGNSAPSGGGGAIYNNISTPSITNCTFYGNSAGEFAGGISDYFATSNIKNCVLWGNTGSTGCEQVYHSSTNPPSHCLIQDGYPNGTNIATGDPHFINAGNPVGPDGVWGTEDDGLRMLADSPAVNSGDNSAVPAGITTDIGGDDRIQHTTVDMGAYECADLSHAISGSVSGDVLEGVTITLSGAASAITTTAADGSYSFGNLLDGNYTLTPSLGQYSFTPTSLSVTLADADSTGNNFISHEYQGSVIYVKSDATGANDGSSWADAYTDLQAGIENAENKDKVWVAAGTYKPSSRPNGGTAERQKHFSLKNGVAVYGGFNGSETSLDQRNPDANPTILSGDIGAVGDSSDNCYHVFNHPTGTGLDDTALDGFTITGGNANGTDDDRYGGGMFNYGSSPVIVNCVFEDNAASVGGGGIRNQASAAPELINCVLTNNSARIGGGMYNIESTPSLTSCVLEGNTASEDGGAIMNYKSPASLVNCVFKSNTATEYGGGIDNQQSSPSLVNCVFHTNSVGDGQGGAIFNLTSHPSITNCAFFGNLGGTGSGIYNLNNSSPTITNCIFWANGFSQIQGYSSTPTVSYCIVENGYAGGTNIITDYPAFTNEGAPVGADGIWFTQDDGLRPAHGSVAINAGDNSAIPGGITLDIAGDYRIQDDTVDIGPYEYGGDGPPTAHSISGSVSGDVVEGVTITLSGDGSDSTATAADGSYSFANLDDGSYTVTPSLAGYIFTPANRGVNLSGADSTGNDFSASIIPTTHSISGTVSGDAVEGVTITLSGDGSDTTATAADGSYSFANLDDGSYTVTPSMTGHTFTPANRGVTLSGADSTGNDFSASINLYNLTYTAGANGTIDGSAEITMTVAHAGDATPVTAIPATGYHFKQWSDGSTANPRTDSNVTADLTVTAEFAVNLYTLTYTAGANGTIDGSAEITMTVAHAGDATPVTAIPATGYHFKQWNDGSTENPRSDGNVTADLTVTAEFEINSYTLTYTAGANGTIDGSAEITMTVAHAGDATPVTAIADAGYHFKQWSDGSTANPRTDSNVTADLSVTAEFEINANTISGTVSGDVLEGVTITLSGDGSDTTITAADGSYSFNDLNDGNYIVTPSLAGYTFSPSNRGVTLSGADSIGNDFSAITIIPDTYSISGTVSGDATEGATVTLSGAADKSTTTAADGSYSFVNLNNGSYTVTPSLSGYTFDPANRGVTLSGADSTGNDFSATVISYTLSYTAGTGGTVNGSAEISMTVNHGSDGSAVTAIADTGYHFVQWSDGSTDNQRTDSNVTASLSVTAEFEINSYTLTYTAGANGTIDGSAEITMTVAHAGDATPVTAIPATGYHFKQWSDGSTANPRTDSNVTADLSVTAEFAINTYSIRGEITGDAAEGVTVTLTGAAEAMTVTAADGWYNFDELLNGDYTVTPSMTGYTFTPSNRQITIADADSEDNGFTAAINSYTLTYTAGANGTIDGSAEISMTVAHGSDGSAVTAVADTGYHFAQWSDGSTANPRTDTNVTAGISVTAEFEINSYTLTYTAGNGGTVNGSAEISMTVTHGSDGSAVTAIADTGYHFAQWSDGSTANPRTDSNVTASLSVTAEFAINSYTLTYTAGTGGSISGATPQSVNHGSDGSAVTAIADHGHHFAQWSDGSTANPRTDSNVTASLSVTAEFAVNATVYVKHDATGANNGHSWTDAFTDLQMAIDSVTDGSTIWVAAGTYKPSSKPNGGLNIDREKHFSLKNGVEVYGGFAGTENSFDQRDIATNPTILSGDIGEADNDSDNCHHVFYHPDGTGLDSTAILDGFTITGGAANGSSPHHHGGGIYNHDSSPTLKNCVFTDNQAAYSGGAIYNQSSSPTITACAFPNNSAGSGGAIYNANSSFAVNACVFSENYASSGGAIYNYSSSPLIVNCLFSDNAANATGGGINNSSSSPTIINCTIVGNLAGANGDGVYNYHSTAIIKNSVLWENGTEEIANAGESATTVSSSLIEDGYPGNGNLDSDPLFVNQCDPAGADEIWGTSDDGLRLSSVSPAINAGANAAVPTGIDTDINGEDRIQSAAVDMGAYEGGVLTLSISGAVSGEISAEVTITLTGAMAATKTTAADGSYSFPLLVDGIYTLTPSVNGYSFNPAEISVTLDGTSSAGNNFTATKAAAATHTISGSVTGAAIEGVTITLAGAGASTVTTTGADGVYAFNGLADGAYTVTPAMPGYSFTPASHSIVLSGNDSIGNDFSAAAGAESHAILGAVSGDATAGVAITLAGAADMTTVTAADGSYSFANLADGAYTVTPDLDGYSFSPASISVTLAGTNSVGNDFAAAEAEPVEPVSLEPVLVKIKSNHKEKLAKTKNGGEIIYSQISQDSYSIMLKLDLSQTNLDLDAINPESAVGLVLGGIDISKSGFNQLGDAEKSSLKGAKGGNAKFTLKEIDPKKAKIKPTEKISLKWNKKKLLLIKITGKRLPDSEYNILNLSNAADGKITDQISGITFRFHDIVWQNDDYIIDYTAKKKTKVMEKDDETFELISWKAKAVRKKAK